MLVLNLHFKGNTKMFSDHRHRTVWLVWTITHALGWLLSSGSLVMDSLALADSGALPPIPTLLLRHCTLWSMVGLIQGIVLLRTAKYSYWWLPCWVVCCAVQWSVFWYLELPRYTRMFQPLSQPVSQSFIDWIDLQFAIALVGIGMMQGLVLWPWLRHSGGSGMYYWLLAHSGVALLFLALFLLVNIELIAPLVFLLLFILPGALYGSIVGFALVHVVKPGMRPQEYASVT
jgi:hypothetical protein